MPNAGLSEAIVLAGGLGTRLRPAVDDRSKPMALIRGRPFLEWLLRALKAEGIERVVIASGYLGDHLEDSLRDSPVRGLDVTFSREDEPLGTGGAARQALAFTKASRIVVLNGDSFCPLQLNALMRVHEEEPFRITLRLVRMDDCGRYGSVEIDPRGAVTAFREKSGNAGAGRINAGIYVLDRECLEELSPGKKLSLERDVFPRWIGRGLGGLEGNGPFVDIGTPESYRVAERILSAELDRLAEEPGVDR